MAHKFCIGDHVWIQPIDRGEFAVLTGGKITAMEKTRVRVKEDNGKEVYVGNQQLLRIMPANSVEGVENMIDLDDLQEYAILKNLEKRFYDQLIYTYTGSMLIALNPYQVLPIYTNALIKQYRNKKIGDLPPHIFAIGDSCYNDLRDRRVNQCVVISGESGAGKTESTKLILQYLTAVSGKHSWIEQQILEANPIMEAFGNAKTVRNDNSSRFGKYIDISFNKAGNIVGAKIEQYLLEKSRIVFQNENERNYHIFYSMISGLTKKEKKLLHLERASDFNYLKGGGSLTCDARDEASEFGSIRSAMAVLNFKEQECNEIFQLLSIILHLGNIKFKGLSISNLDASDVSDKSLLNVICSFLGVDEDSLAHTFTKRSILAQGDNVVSHLNKDQAYEVRDALAKALYGKLFDSIVEKINGVIFKRHHDANLIGVLDIFGFENFKINSFEQLCINYANESLQQFFLHHIFKLEQEYYAKEGINWKRIEFVDNQNVLDMIGVKQMNIMSLIDEESKFPKGTDVTMLSKLHSTHGDKGLYNKPKSDLQKAFGIQHFAGEVFYEIPGFLEKNRDSFSYDLIRLIKMCKNNYLKNLFQEDLRQDFANKRTITLSYQFRLSLDTLMRNLNSCHPYFIRCIKPNETKQPKLFDKILCCRQLRYSGLMETARIRKAGYPIRYTYLDFIQRYHDIAKVAAPKTNSKLTTEAICNYFFTKGEDYQCGNTKIFLKEAQHLHLEKARNKALEGAVIVLQRTIKGWIYRRRFLKLKAAAITLQKNFRARGYRSHYLVLSLGYQRLQAKIRARQLAFSYNKQRRMISQFQALCKGYLIRQKHIFGKIFNVVELKRNEERELQSKGEKNYRRISENNMQKRMVTLAREYSLPKDVLIEEDLRSASEIVDNEFHFLLNLSTATVRKKNKDVLTKLKNDIDANLSNFGEDLSAYNFRKFAATYFSKNVNPQHSTKLLRESLLDLPTPDDMLAAQMLWITILRFMGDLPEPQFEEAKSSKDSIMSQLTHTLSRSFTNRKEFKELLKQETHQASLDKASRHQLISMTLKRKNRLLEEVRLGLVEDTFASDNYKTWANRKTGNLEKLHFIIGHGILRSELRDEIFCQICKQLTDNPSKTSHARGWILLSLCVGCFPPSETFINYLRAFIHGGPPGYAPYCEKRLHRTFKNGARTQPPSWLELQATKNKEPIQLEVAFMNRHTKNIVVDSASTAEEICRQISVDLNLKDAFGFSLFMTMYDKVMSLGSDTDHIMDAISQCEQYAKEKGSREHTTEWSLFYRKEIFTPWHNPTEDPFATDLIYHQIIRGIKNGEYKCNVEDDLATLAAQQYYINNGAVIDPKVLRSQLRDYLPRYIVKVQSVNDWEKKVVEAFNKSTCVKHKYPAIKAKEDIVRYAKMVWPILFSRFFEAFKISGPHLPKNNVIIAVNWTGVFMVDEREQILLELSFVEIYYAGFEQERANFARRFILRTIRSEEYIFNCPDAANLSKLLIYLLDGLKKRSRYCIAMQNYKHPSRAPSFLTLKQGDLIILENNGELLSSSTWAFGECKKQSGNFPTELVQILPTLSKPPSSVLSAFKSDRVHERANEGEVREAQKGKLYTLEDYARVHFRPSKVLDQKPSLPSAVRRSSKEELWKYTNQPIVQPLLKKVLSFENSSKAACKTFAAILKYMGDLPTEEISTDEIFVEALSDDLLKDEIYCQLMRQLTYNRLFESEERGWELLYLATGLFIPSPALTVELNKFLKSRVHSFVKPSLKRLLRTQKLGPRTHPPHLIEVEAIKRRSMEIYHKIYFPDNTNEAFEVYSNTKVGDLCSVITDKLGLITKDGFSIFIKISDRMFSIPESSFFYDFLQELTSWVKQAKLMWHNNAPMRSQYQLFFMKKLWLNSRTGEDVNADLIFHYHQELPKYLRGYHKTIKEDTIKLGALIYKAQFDDNLTQFSEVTELIPQNIIEKQSVEEWKKQIQREYFNIKMTAEEAKLKFLKTVSRYDTFGCTFFEVKQTSNATYPADIIIAINEKGVSVLDPQTKVLLVAYGYLELNNWSSGNTFFYLTIGNMMKATKLLCETAQGYIMDDLITSYTEKLRNSEHKTTL